MLCSCMMSLYSIYELSVLFNTFLSFLTERALLSLPLSLTPYLLLTLYSTIHSLSIPFILFDFDLQVHCDCQSMTTLSLLLHSTGTILHHTVPSLRSLNLPLPLIFTNSSEYCSISLTLSCSVMFHLVLV